MTGANPPRAGTVPIDHYSTDAIPTGQRHALWAQTAWPSVAALFDSTALADFSTEADLVQLDQLFLQYARSTARAFERSPERAREDGIDALGIGVQLDGGAMDGEAEGRRFVVPEGAMLLLDLTRPCRITHPSGASIQIAVPRALAQHFLGPPPSLHGTVVPPARAGMLIGHLLQLRRALPSMEQGQQTLLMRTVLDLLAVALGREAVVELPQPGAAPPAADRDRRARDAIERRLGLPSLNAASLAEQLGLSRATLFRLFKDEGGVANYIRGRRLHHVRLALEEPIRHETAADLAYRFGFADPSQLSRLFKARYGVTLSDYRAAHVRALTDRGDGATR